MTDFDLRAWRKRMDLTQEQAAAELGTATRTYQRWEKGEAERVVVLACQALEIRKAWPAALDSLRVVSALVRGH